MCTPVVPLLLAPAPSDHHRQETYHGRLAGKAGIATEGAVGMGWVPVELMDEPDDVAWTVLWLASDEAKFVTGAEIVIDGGCKA